VKSKHIDVFAGQFDAVKRELHTVLNSSFHGILSDALHAGNTAVMALRVLEGTYNVDELSYRVTTPDDRDDV